MVNYPTKMSVVVLVALPLFFSVGCGGRSKPDGMPSLYPCQLTFTQENAPLADAFVTFHSPEAGFQWTISGKTDPNGVVKFNTNGFYPGVPEGKYRVSVTKTDENATHYINVVHQQYLTADTTPLEIEIQKKGNDKTFDLGKATETVIGRKKTDEESKDSK